MQAHRQSDLAISEFLSEKAEDPNPTLLQKEDDKTGEIQETKAKQSRNQK